MKKITRLLLFTALLGAITCTGANCSQTIHKKAQSLSKYQLSISFGKTSKNNIPKEICITFKNNCDFIALHNFQISFYCDKDSYRGINEDFRFSPSAPLTLMGDTSFTKTIKLNDFTFTSIKTKETKSLKEMMNTLQSTSEYRIIATINDPSKKENPYESNLYSRSNMLTVKND
jgi:hypothetical protein